jgi:hypothetical protein
MIIFPNMILSLHYSHNIVKAFYSKVWFNTQGERTIITREQKVRYNPSQPIPIREGNMEDRRLPPLMEYFSEVEDPRRETRNKKYPLIEDIVIAFLAVMSGADGWESI